MQNVKSKGHGKISRDFGRMLLRFWLSKDGFEFSGIRHPGIHLIVRNPHTKENMGILVSCRTRTKGKEAECITVHARAYDNFSDACNAEGCTPYFAFVVDSPTIMRAFIISQNRFVELCRPRTKPGFYWEMGDNHLSKYGAYEDIKTFQLKTETIRWWAD